MFPDYEKLVLQDYRWKKSKSIISSEIMYPTRAKLKRACVTLCRGEISNQDKKTIRDFCKKWDDTKTFIQNITAYDEDKFRPLSDYLTEATEKTDPVNIELLACLINFPHRPYDFTKNYAPLLEMQAGAPLAEWEAQTNADIASNTTTEITSEINNPLLQDTEHTAGSAESITDTTAAKAPEPEDDKITGAPAGNKKKKIKRIWIVVISFIILPAGYGWHRFEISLAASQTGGCMYWTGDHYESIPCDKKVQDTYVVAMDTFRLKHFKKITQWDTITHRAIGWVWYAKKNNQVEYFTASGKHPVFMNDELKPITHHIIEVYIDPFVNRKNQ